MATVNKDFKIKNGLIVEGSNATVNGFDILTKKTADQNYIIDLIGGSATPDATPDTVVLRDENADFAAGIITADLVGDVTGQVSDISNHDTDDLAEGSTNKYYTDSRVKDVLTGATKTNITIETIGGDLHITAENGVDDSTTDDLEEGTTNKYYSDTLVDNHLSGGDGISYSSGTISVDLDPVSGLTTSTGMLAIDRTTVDGWYDASGAAGDVASDLSTHEGLTSAHGVTGDIVGTSDTQTLTNKTIGDTLNFVDGFGNIMDPNKITIDGTNLAVYASNDLTLRSGNNNIILDAADGAYYGSVSAENEIATHSYVDNAVSGLAWKQAVNLLSTTNVAIESGGSPADLVGTVIDGHAALTTSDAGYRILLSGQSSGGENGIYELVAQTGQLIAQRPADADTYTELVGAAVYVMEGTQYGSTSWVQGNHYLSGYGGQDWTQFSGQGSVTAGSGITVDGLEVSVDRSTVDTWYDPSGAASDAIDAHDVGTGVHGLSGDIVGTSDSQTLTNKTIDGASNTISGIANSSLNNSSITVNGYSTDLGSSVTLNTDDVQETGAGTNKYFTSQRVQDVLTGAALTNIQITSVGGALSITAENGVDDSTTDDLEEGINNHYFTDARAEDAAGNLLANATKSNIDITYVDGVLSLTAENGVADSDTDDLEEGTTNLYFTDERAVDALEAVVPNFVELQVNTVAKQVAATLSAPTAGIQNAFVWSAALYKSAEFLVKVAYGSHTEISKVLLTLDTSNNIAITEYGVVGTNGSASSISATIVMAPVGDDVVLQVTTTNNNSTVTVMGTLLV